MIGYTYRRRLADSDDASSDRITRRPRRDERLSVAAVAERCANVRARDLLLGALVEHDHLVAPRAQPLDLRPAPPEKSRMYWVTPRGRTRPTAPAR